MAAKGSTSGSCCCTSCETMPFTAAQSDTPVFAPDQRISFKGHPVDYVQGFCCTCLPTHVCVSVECIATGEITTKHLFIECNTLGSSVNGVARVYRGNIAIAGVFYLAEITLEVSNDLKCYVCLEIPSAGFEKQCLELTQAHFAMPLMWCKSLTYSIDQYGLRNPTKFTGQISTYGCPVIAVSLSVPSLQAITGRASEWIDYYGTIGPEYEAGRRIPDDNSIDNRCAGCGCIANAACLTIFRTKDGTSDSYPLTLGCPNCSVPCPTGHIYSSILGDYGPLVAIEKDPSCLPGDPECPCVLMLRQLSNTQTFGETLPSPVISKGLNEGECPFPKHRWELTDELGNVTQVDFRTESCVSEPCSINPAGCCVGIDMPNVIHCTISRQGDYPSDSCECLPVTIPMLFDGAGINPAWTGRYATQPGNGSWCNDPDRDFKVRMYCAGNTWAFQYGAGSNYQESPCSGSVMAPASGFACRPVFFQFVTNGACCGPSAIPDGMGGFIIPVQTLTFTITE